MKPPRPAPDADRRRFLVRGCRLAAASACVPLLTTMNLAGCTGDLPEHKHVTGPLRHALDTLPEGERVNLTHGERQIELIRQGDHVTARLLWCTHQGCTVAWLPDEQVYLCPCHDGRFNAEGHPIYGPPRRDLDLLPVTIENGDVIVDV